MALTLLRWYHNPIEHIFILVLELKKKKRQSNWIAHQFDDEWFFFMVALTLSGIRNQESPNFPQASLLTLIRGKKKPTSRLAWPPEQKCAFPVETWKNLIGSAELCTISARTWFVGGGNSQEVGVDWNSCLLQFEPNLLTINESHVPDGRSLLYLCR